MNKVQRRKRELRWRTPEAEFTPSVLGLAFWEVNDGKGLTPRG